MKNIRIYISIILVCINFATKAQSDSINYDLEFIELNSTGNYAPFWMQSKSYGLILQQPNSIYFNLGLSKDMHHSKRLFDYGFKVNASIQSDYRKVGLMLHEYYLNTRLSVFGLSVGAKKEKYGNQDSTLSSGGLLFSQNSRPLPKIWVGIEKFTPIPFTTGYLEIKGGLSHGWFNDNIYVQKVMMHHKYMYLRAGGDLAIRIQYGIDHAVQWGGISPDYGKQPNSFSDFKKICFGLSGGRDAVASDQINKLGNHIVSQNMKLEIDLSDFDISAYWQNISEDGPIRPLWNSMNISDGLWGISIKNKHFPYIQGLLYEYINTTDQSGPYHDKDGIVFGGSDSYFINRIYSSGWNYYSRTIGTPFILSPLYNNDGTIQTKNNRIQAHHFGIEGIFGTINYRALATFSKSFGTYSIPTYPAKSLNSVFLELTKPISHKMGIEGRINLNADYGSFYGNSFGILIGLRKRGNFISY